MAKNPKILSIVLAGGEGTRLMPLTRDRAKPAVPFGGVFRLIDFPLSNLVNSGICRPWCSPSTSPIRLTVIFPRCGVFRRCSATTYPLFRLSSDLASTGISAPRRHLPDHQHHRGRAAGYCGDRRRRPRLPHGFPADGAAAYRIRRGVHGGGYSPADQPVQPVRRDRG
mgnify:CR=1 FL=1